MIICDLDDVGAISVDCHTSHICVTVPAPAVFKAVGATQAHTYHRGTEAEAPSPKETEAYVFVVLWPNGGECLCVFVCVCVPACVCVCVCVGVFVFETVVACGGD